MMTIFKCSIYSVVALYFTYNNHYNSSNGNTIHDSIPMLSQNDTVPFVNLMDGPRIEAANQVLEKELNKETRGFTIDNCIRFNPEKLYNLLEKTITATFKKEGTLSFLYYSEITKKQTAFSNEKAVLV